jgi:hypothetical protein
MFQVAAACAAGVKAAAATKASNGRKRLATYVIDDLSSPMWRLSLRKYFLK